nr:hypothetical protein [Haloferax larsenii]
MSDLEDRVEELEAREELMRERMTRAFELIEEQADTIEAPREDLAESEQERERLVFRVGKLEAILPDETTPYDQLSREERIMRVQDYVMERSYASNGRFSITYDDVLWSVFDGEPSAGYCYKLMQLAAQEDGFSYGESDGKKLRVDLDHVNDDGVLSRVNNGESEEAR